jgi:hypothetical protein
MGRAMVRESREMVLAYFKHYQSGVWGVRELRVSLSGVVFKNTRRRHLRPGTLQRVPPCMRVPTRPICSGPPAMARAQAQ